jgi:hypothetical protein
MFAKNWVQHDQGGAIGLSFKLFDWFFDVVLVIGVIGERIVVQTYAHTSNITNSSDERDQTNKHTIFRNKLGFMLI